MLSFVGDTRKIKRIILALDLTVWFGNQEGNTS